jgi:hypothetical protein
MAPELLLSLLTSGVYDLVLGHKVFFFQMKPVLPWPIFEIIRHKNLSFHFCQEQQNNRVSFLTPAWWVYLRRNASPGTASSIYHTPLLTSLLKTPQLCIKLLSVLRKNTFVEQTEKL